MKIVLKINKKKVKHGPRGGTNGIVYRSFET